MNYITGDVFDLNMDTILPEILRYLLVENITYVEDIASICTVSKKWKEFRELEWRIIDDETLIIDISFLAKFPNITMIKGPYLLIDYFSRDLNQEVSLSPGSEAVSVKKLKYVKLLVMNEELDRINCVSILNKFFSACDCLYICDVDGMYIEYRRGVADLRELLLKDVYEGNKGFFFKRKEKEEGTEIFVNHEYTRTIRNIPGLSKRNISSISLTTLSDIDTTGSWGDIKLVSIYYKSSNEVLYDEYTYQFESALDDMIRNRALENFRRFVYKGDYYCIGDGIRNIMDNMETLRGIVDKLMKYTDITKIDRLDLLFDVKDAMMYESMGLRLKRYHLLSASIKGLELEDILDGASWLGERSWLDEGPVFDEECQEWISRKMREGVEIIIHDV